MAVNIHGPRPLHPLSFQGRDEVWRPAGWSEGLSLSEFRASGPWGLGLIKALFFRIEGLVFETSESFEGFQVSEVLCLLLGVV